MKRIFAHFVLLVCIATTPAVAQQQTPVFTFDSTLNMFFSEDNGNLMFGDHVVAFAPEGQFNGKAMIADQAGNLLMQADFFPDYQFTHQVFGKVRIKAAAGHQLTEPGLYQIVFVVDGTPVTRMPIVVRQTGAGDDPFKPVKTYAYDGFWRTFAYLTYGEFKDEKTVTVNYWVGSLDLADPAKGEMFIIELIHNDEVIAHTPRTQGHIAPGHFEWGNLTLRHPHEKGKEVNAPMFMHKDWVANDGLYELRFRRQKDGQMIRSLDFQVLNGEIQQHPRAALDYQPRIDFIAPRVQKRGGNMFEMLEAIWIEDRQIVVE